MVFLLVSLEAMGRCCALPDELSLAARSSNHRRALHSKLRSQQFGVFHCLIPRKVVQDERHSDVLGEVEVREEMKVLKGEPDLAETK